MELKVLIDWQKNYNIAIGINADKEMECAGISNEGSIKCIKKAGFKKVGVRKGFYSKQNDDALVMIKEIKQ